MTPHRPDDYFTAWHIQGVSCASHSLTHSLTHSLISFAIAIFAVGCGGGGSDSGQSSGACNAFKILNGSECESDSFPVVRLIIDDRAGCTGTVISNDEVLTAAHCVGSTSIKAVHDHGTQSATSAFSNPLARFSVAFDIAIVRFPNIARNLNISPAHFGLARDTQVGDRIKVVGYGQDGNPTLVNGNPRGTELVVSGIGGGLLHSVFATTSSSPCHGDSGGAATYNGLVVASVVSGGLPNGVDSCAAGSVANYADLQVKGNVDFIRQYAPGAVFE